MSDHELIWEHDRDMVRVEAICHAPADAECRLSCSHGCESWSIERDERGPFHIAYVGEGGEMSGGEESRHDMHPVDYCNVCAFLNEDPSLIPESTSNYGPPFEIGRTPFEPVWEGDYYTWRRVAS